MDDLRRQRIYRDERREFQAPGPVLGSAAFVGVVTTAGTTTSGKFLKVSPVNLTGTQSERSARTLTTLSGSVTVAFIGPDKAANGDYLFVRSVRHRWVADKFMDGVVVAACASPIPKTLYVTYSDCDPAHTGSYIGGLKAPITWNGSVWTGSFTFGASCPYPGTLVTFTLASDLRHLTTSGFVDNFGGTWTPAFPNMSACNFTADLCYGSCSPFYMLFSHFTAVSPIGPFCSNPVGCPWGGNGFLLTA